MMSALDTSITSGMAPCMRGQLSMNENYRVMELTLAAFLNHWPVSVFSSSPLSSKRRRVAISVLTLTPGYDGETGAALPTAICSAVTDLMIAARSIPWFAPVRKVAERPPMKLFRENAAGLRNAVVA